ncbi:hypothetical protein GW796_00820 [archaeon]|nr:hypothetical protein [archaeon]NCQ50448.1 hypothetical protein [archaeon]
MSQEESKEIIKDLFDSNDFQIMFELVAERNRQIKEHQDLMGKFFKLLNIDNLRGLLDKNKMLEFLDALIPFFRDDERFNKQEKKAFLNGCENILFLNSLMFEKYDYAEYLNQFRLDKDLKSNRSFLIQQIEANDTKSIEKLLEYSDKVNFDSSLVLRLLYSKMNRDYSFIKRIIVKHGLDINGFGEIYKEYNVSGTFLHSILIEKDVLSQKYLNNFLKDFGDKINFELKIKIKEEEYTWIELILEDKNLETTEKIEKITSVLNYGSLSEKQINDLCGILISEEIISIFYDNVIYDALFSHQSFNSSFFDREKIINKLLSLDNSKLFDAVREKTNNTINPTSVMLDKLFRFISPVNYNDPHPFSIWMKANGLNLHASINTLNSLILHYKREMDEVSFKGIRIHDKLLNILIDNGIIDEPKRKVKILVKNEEVIKESEKPLIEMKEKIDQPSTSKITKATIKDIKDVEIKNYIDSIIFEAQQFKTIYTEGDNESQDFDYIKNILPKLLSRTIQNYLEFTRTKDPIEVKKNTLIQLKLLNKKTFEILNKSLEK